MKVRNVRHGGTDDQTDETEHLPADTHSESRNMNASGFHAETMHVHSIRQHPSGHEKRLESQGSGGGRARCLPYALVYRKHCRLRSDALG